MGSTIADIRQSGIDSKIQLVKGIMENYHEIFDTDIQWAKTLMTWMSGLKNSKTPNIHFCVPRAKV